MFMIINPKLIVSDLADGYIKQANPLTSLIRGLPSIGRTLAPVARSFGTVGRAAAPAARATANTISRGAATAYRYPITTGLGVGTAGGSAYIAHNLAATPPGTDDIPDFDANRLPMPNSSELMPSEIQHNSSTYMPGHIRSIVNDLNDPNRPQLRPGEAARHEDRLSEYLRTTNGRANNLQAWLHEYPGPRGRMHARNPFGDVRTDVTARNMYNEVMSNRSVPTVGMPTTQNAYASGWDNRSNLARLFSDRPAPDQTRTRMYLGPMPTQNWPNHLIALHEANHHRQGQGGIREQGNTFAELTPSLADIPQYAEWYRRRAEQQTPRGLFRGQREQPNNLDMNLTTPEGMQWNTEAMRRQANTHGLFQGRSMAELLNTPQGRQWLNQAMGVNR